MEWFWKMIDHFQKSAAGSALQSFSPIDWVLLIAIFFGLVQGSRKGFSDMFGKLLGVFLISMVTLHFYELGAESLVSLLPVFSIQVARPLSFFLLGVCSWLVVSRVVDMIGKFFKVEAQGFLKTLGGMIFGGLRMVLLLSFLSQFLLFLPIEPLQNVFKPGRTYTGYTISRFAPDLHQWIMSPFRKSVSRKISDSVKGG